MPKIALNVITDTIQAIDDDLDDAAKFVAHKPRLPPYQAPEFKSRVLWVHTTAGYVAWMTGGITDEGAIDAELERRWSQITQLISSSQEKLEDATKRADAAEDDAGRARKTHETYKKTKQREVTNLKQTISSAPSKTEFDDMKAQVHKVKSSMSDEDYSALKEAKGNPRLAFMKLLELCQTSLDDAVADFKSEESKGAQRAAFEFYENDGSWVAITDGTIIGALLSLMQKGSKVSYSFGGHNYEATLCKKGKKKAGTDDYDIDQKNLGTGAIRKVRDTSSHSVDPAALKKKQMAEILYGSKSFISLDDAFCDEILSGFRFDIDQTYEISTELANLAESFAAVGSGWKYTVPVGTIPTNANALKFTSNTDADGKNECNSELFIKPIALFNWLTLARARGYTAARIVMHGGTKEAYAGVRDDPMGFKMEHAGRHGQAFGNGLYFGLSDHATIGYNAQSGLPSGSAILTLLLTHECIGWQHHHHGGYTSGYDETQAKEYKTITFSTPIEGMDNAIVVHEPWLVLPLGLVRAYDDKMGWIMSAQAYGQGS